MFPKTGMPWNHYIHSLTQGTWICWRQCRAFTRQRPFASFKKREPFKVVVPITSKSKGRLLVLWLFWRCLNKVITTPTTTSMKIGSCDIVWFCFILRPSGATKNTYLRKQTHPQLSTSSCSIRFHHAPFSVHVLLCQASSRLFLLDFQGHFSKATRSEDCSLPAKTARSWTGSRCQPQKWCHFFV